MSQLTPEQFLKDVSKHEMQIIRDDGVYRHIRFSRPHEGSSMFFELVTWPGHLCYSGDMGTYVFSRTQDMFEFFRKAGDKVYWAQKCIADGCLSKTWEFDEEGFIKAINEYFQSWVEDNQESTTEEERNELWEEIQREVFSASGEGMTWAASRFSHTVNNKIDFAFDYLFENTFERLTWRFEWCSRAILWGLKQYDTHKASITEEAK